MIGRQCLARFCNQRAQPDRPGRVPMSRASGKTGGRADARSEPPTWPCSIRCSLGQRGKRPTDCSGSRSRPPEIVSISFLRKDARDPPPKRGADRYSSDVREKSLRAVCRALIGLSRIA